MEIDEMNEKKKVLYVQYAAPGVYPPIERSAQIFKTHGWHVDFLAVRPSGQEAALTSSMHSEDEIEYHTHHRGGFRALRSYLKFWLRAWRRVRREKPDAVYLSDIYTYPAGFLIALTSPTTTILHEHDTELNRSGFFRFLHVFRGPFARRADIRINPQKERGTSMEQVTGCGKVMIVHNCPSLEEIRDMPSFDQKAPGLILWHHGSLGPGRLPYTIVDAMADCPDDVSLMIAGYETINTKGFIASLKAHAESLGIGHRVIYHGAMKRDALYATASQAHVGLSVFVEKFVEPMVGASNKPFDYLGCNMALLVNHTEEWQDFFVSKGVAASCDPADPADIARVINQLYQDRNNLRALADRGRHMIETEWNYEAQFQPVLDTINRTLIEKRKADT